MSEMPMDYIERRSLPEPMTGCWLWTGSVGHNGYGLAHHAGERRAHRIAWRLFTGVAAGIKQVLHRCDTRACVNPAHLFIGTHRDNFRDAVEKRRLRHGTRHWNARLSTDDVDAIRASSELQRILARKYGVHENTISRIRRRVRRAHG